MTDTTHIVHEALADHDLTPADFNLRDGDGSIHCPTCDATAYDTGQGLATHHFAAHGTSFRAGVCGGDDAYQALLHDLHVERRLTPGMIGKALPETVSVSAIRDDCKRYEMYRPGPEGMGGLAGQLALMDADEISSAGGRP